LINGFFVVPVIAAAQLNPWISAIVAVPAVLVYLVSSLVIRKVDADPISEIVLRTGLLAVVGIGCVLLSRVQRSRVSTIARLLDERNDCWPRWSPLSSEQRDLPRPCMTVLAIRARRPSRAGGGGGGGS
jgi:hypothetical protein